MSLLIWINFATVLGLTGTIYSLFSVIRINLFTKTQRFAILEQLLQVRYSYSTKMSIKYMRAYIHKIQIK